MKTVEQARRMLDAGTPRKWSQARKYATFGYTQAQVRKQLVTFEWCGKKITVHKKVVNSLKKIERQIREVERKKGWQPWVPERVDTFNWRTVRGGSSRSSHSWGIALDIDPSTNGYYPVYRPNATTDIPMRVFQAFADEQWTLGMTWNKPLDIMHFSYAGG